MEHSFCNTRFFKLAITIILIGSVITILRAGIAFGQWLFTFLN